MYQDKQILHRKGIIYYIKTNIGLLLINFLINIIFANCDSMVNYWQILLVSLSVCKIAFNALNWKLNKKISVFKYSKIINIDQYRNAIIFFFKITLNKTLSGQLLLSVKNNWIPLTLFHKIADI